MKKLKSVNDQKELGAYIASEAGSDKYSYIVEEEGKLMVNEAQVVARVIVDNYLHDPKSFSPLLKDMKGLSVSFSDKRPSGGAIRASRIALIDTILYDMFADYDRFIWFSSSKKMMRKIAKNVNKG